MRRNRFLWSAIVLALTTGPVFAQTDGQCTVPLNTDKFESLVGDAVEDLAPFGLSAPLVTESPVADGVLSDGEYSNSCYFTFAENENPGQSWPNLDNLEDGDADLTSYMHLAHTEDHLFVAFEVFDDFRDHTEGAASFTNDGVELFVNPDLDGEDAWGVGKFQIYVDAQGDEPSENSRGSTAGITEAADEQNPEEGEYYSAGLWTPGDPEEDVNYSYVVEMQIPLTSLNLSGEEDDLVPATTGDFVLVNAAWDDNDEDDDVDGGQHGHHVLWHADGAGSPFGGGEPIWNVPLELSEPAAPVNPSDVNGDGFFDGGDIDALAAAVTSGETGARFDLDGSGSVDDDDREYLIVTLQNSFIGDSNLDGEFNSSDFVTVFQAGEYEDALDGNSTWATGDWNGDMEFDSSDFVAAFQAGGYETGPRVAAVPEPSSLVLLSLGMLAFLRRRK